MKDTNISAKDFDIRYDILRSIGLIAIILAHSGPPQYILQLRNFDVPLLVLIAGSVFSLSRSGAGSGYISYVKARLARLLLPVWSFYAFFFVFTCFVVSIMQVKYPFSLRYIFDAFTLNGQYVWIIKVFVLVALIAVPLLNLYKRYGSSGRYGVFIIGAYVLYEFLFLIYRTTHIFTADAFIKDYLFYLLPYACVFGLGILLKDTGKRTILGIAFISFAVFIAGFFILRYSPTQLYKYPPRIYYLSYALAVSCLLYYAVYDLKINVLPARKAVQFISRNSLWIYLWHIFAVKSWSFAAGYIALPGLWPCKFIAVFFIATSIVLLQNIISMKARQKMQRK